jgi:glycosyltransferase involved in cell wall biosynthesis/predicted HAD superfamily hydrolase
MSTRPRKRHYAFVVPNLSQVSTQNEDLVQLLVFAAARLEQEVSARTDRSFSTTIVSVEHDTSGWKHLSSLFSEEALKHIAIEELKEPAVPCLAIPNHKAAYALFEFLKDRAFDEVHCLDRCGLAYYPTQAKRLGLYFLDTVFAVHVVGATVFRKEAEDHLLDDVGALVDDLLERGSLERADVIYVHDRKAWGWYSDKIEARSDARVHDLAWAETTHCATELAPIDEDVAPAIVYYGPLGADGGLPLFCDAVGRALPQIRRPAEVFFVGAPQAIGGMDAVSYIRLRSAKWGVPVTIRRDLTISDEIAFVGSLHGVVFCNTVRREGLRSRLIASSGLQVLQVEQSHAVLPEKCSTVCPANPGPIAQALVEALTAATVSRPRRILGLVDLWRAGRPRLAGLEDVAPSPPLRVSRTDGPKVSVCLTHYCRPQKLRRALASLRRQDYRNFEVIVVDDGSPDPDVQRELVEIRQEIESLGWRLLVQENRYLGAARNYGASHASGDYLMFMDDDNVAKPNEISTLVAVAQRTGADIVTAFCDVFETEDTLESDKPPPMRFTPFGSDPALGAFTNCYGDANALYSRGVFNKLGGFTEDYGITHEDWELFCRASLEGVKMVCVPEPLFWYRVDPNGMFRGWYTQLHKSANLRRHIRPFLEQLPYYQAKLVQLAQGLTTELPAATVGASTRAAAPRILGSGQGRLPYARVAVITRTKDRPLLLRRAIRSVLDQTFRDWLLVIVNDGGSPESVELVLDEVAEELAGRLLVLHHPVSFGMQTASNAGISRCDSDFIVIHDDDDTWEPTFLARTVSHLDDHGWNPKLGGVVTWSQVIVEELDENGEITVHDRFIFNDKLHGISLLDLAVENRFPPISFLFRRAAMDAVGPFNDQHGVLGDWEFHLRLLRWFTIDVIAEPLANYHHRATTTIGTYGNSVHAQSDLHQSTRVDLLNSAMREELSGENGLSLAQLLTFGDLQRTLLEEQAKGFQQLHDYLWTIEQRVNPRHWPRILWGKARRWLRRRVLDPVVRRLKSRFRRNPAALRARDFLRRMRKRHRNILTDAGKRRQVPRPAPGHRPGVQDQQEFETLLDLVDVVSFDLFDTLVQRDGLFSPKDLFYRVQEEAERRLGLRLVDFATLRVRAEETARVRASGRGQEEVTLNEIYAELARLLDLEPRTARSLLQIELECERSAITSLEGGKRLFETALGAGKAVVIVSDTYFPEDFVAEVVGQNGYRNAAKVYASSAYGKTKSEGSLYDVVLEDLCCAPSRLLHIGDNQHSDVAVAVSKGIRTLFVPTPQYRLRRRHGVADVPSGNLVMAAMLCDISRRSEKVTARDDPQSVIEQTATQNLALLYFAFSTWLLEQLRNGGYERVYFAARDGLIMKRFFDLAAAAAGFEIDSRYLYVSRAALYPSLVFTEPETARQLFCHHWDRLTIEDALRRTSLTFEECTDLLARRGLGDRELPLDRSTVLQFSAFLDEVWPMLERNNEENYRLTVGYLRQEMVLTKERAAFVDIGWHGSLQNSVLKLLSHLGVAKDLGGYYLGTFEKPTGAVADFRAEGFLVDNDEPGWISRLVRSSGPSVLELFHSAGHGCVRGYKRNGARVLPILEDNPVEREQFERIMAPLQNMAFDFVSEQLGRFSGATMEAPDPGLVARMGLRVIYAPTPAEAKVFGHLRMASDFGGPMKSITGGLEWDLKEIDGDPLPDGILPLWLPGFHVLKSL